MKSRKNEELKEQAKFVRWARKQAILISSINQSTYTTSWKAISDNNTAGTIKGVPDLIMVIPKERRNNNMPKTILIEMKKLKGGVVSKEQKIWITALDSSDGVSAKICHGSEEAIAFTDQFLEKELPQPSDEDLQDFINNL